jgi:nucleotide-binding universal stress UspA family protein
MKYLIVPVTGNDTDQAVFETALLVAQTFDSHIEFLHVRQDVREVVASIVATDLCGPPNLDQLTEEMERTADAREGKARHLYESFCASHALAQSAEPSSGISVEWTAHIGSEPDLLALRGRDGDLIVLGRGTERRDVVDQALVYSGRPLLIAPATPPRALLDTVVVAWNNTPEAARAVTAAMPFLIKAKSVTILSVEEKDQDGHGLKTSCNRLVRALRWHSPIVQAQHLPGGGHKPVDVLLDAATSLGASLLVMGGFSHSRLRELVFGGFTQRVLSGAALPVLIAH